MRVLIRPDAATVATEAGAMVCEVVRTRTRGVLGLATGATMVGPYRELARLHREEGLDFSGLTTFNLDEYVDLPVHHPRSFRSFMEQHLFSQVNLSPDRVHVPDGSATDLEAQCLAYEEAIRLAGGIDLQLLGIGTDGHIAFNEPGSSLGSRTRLKALTRTTRRANAGSFDGEDAVPRIAITMGVGTILESRRCLLLATGASKAEAIRGCVEGPVTSQVTASALQLHADVTVIVDEAAATRLERRDYYAEVEEAERHIRRRRSRGK